MRKGARDIGPIARLTTVTLVVVGLIAFALAGSAASLGGITVGSVFTQTTDVQIPNPAPIISTDFSGCTNFVDGWTDESGGTWTSHLGNWQCLGHEVVRAQERVSFANLTVSIEQSSGIRVSTGISDVSHQSKRSGPGLALLRDDEGEFVYVVYRRDTDELLVGVSGEDPFAVVNELGDIDSGVMTASLVGNDLYVDFAGATVGPVDLSTEAPGLVGNTRFGLVADNDNFSEFGDFTIELLP